MEELTKEDDSSPFQIGEVNEEEDNDLPDLTEYGLHLDLPSLDRPTVERLTPSYNDGWGERYHFGPY